MAARAPHPVDVLDAELQRVLTPLLADPASPRGRGRPPLLTEALLWSAVAVCVLRQQATQTAVWRLLCQLGLWEHRLAVTPEAVRRGLHRTEPARIERLFQQVTAALASDQPADPSVAPFATGVYALDDSVLDPVPRVTAGTRACQRGDDALLPGRLSVLFNLRTQQVRHAILTDQPRQNEKVAAWPMAQTLERGSLLVVDLGYFAFPWFDALTDDGLWFVTRMKGKVSTVPRHGFTRTGQVSDTLVWLGAYRANQAKHPMRLVEVQVGRTRRRYLTNVLDPMQLSPAALVALYAQRWTIEEAFRLLKVELGLGVLWSARWPLVQQQVWAVLLIAQILLAIRSRIAVRAGVSPYVVSLRLLLRDLPWIVREHPDDSLGVIADSTVTPHGYLRPPRRRPVDVPTDLPVTPAPPEALATREPRYDHRVHSTAERRDQRHRARARLSKPLTAN